MTANEFVLHAVFVAGAALFLGTEKECNCNNVADTLEVREY